MPGYYGSFNRVVKTDAGTPIDGSLTMTADDYSETLNLNGFRRVCIWFDCGTFDDADETLDIDFQFSGDGGTTWNDYPNAIGTVQSTNAALAQLDTTNGDQSHMEFWELVNGPDVRYRIFFDFGGTTPNLDSCECRVICWDRYDGSV